MTGVVRFSRRLLAWFLPERCVFCGEVIEPLSLACRRCRETLSVIKPPICGSCGAHRKACHCGKRRLHIDRVAAPFYYEGAARDGVLRLKYEDDPDAIAYLARQVCAVIRREYDVTAIDGVVYVPMTARARRAREYNQSELLAQAVARRLALPVYDALVKLYETPPQKTLDLHARSGNVLGVFDVTDQTVRGKTLLLLDDVMTTGATLHECAKMLKIYGAKSVPAAVIAVPKPTEKTDEIL